MTNIANSATYSAYLTNSNVSLGALLGGRTSGHVAQLRADRAYNGSYDLDDDIYAGERLHIAHEGWAI